MPDEPEEPDRTNGTAEAPWDGNPLVTRKEAWQALKEGHAPLTEAQAKDAAALVLANTPKTEIARSLGFKATTKMGERIMRHPQVRREILTVMKKHNVTLDRLGSKLSQLLDSEKVTYAKEKGVFTDERRDPDGQLQHAAMVTGLELYGAYGHKRQHDGGSSGPKMVIKIDAKYAQVFFGQGAGQPLEPVQPGADGGEDLEVPEADHCD